MNVGNIKNIGGVVNLGTVYGNVVAGIQKAYKNADLGSDPNPAWEEIHSQLLKLAEQINTHASSIARPDVAIEQVERCSNEVFSKEPDKGIVETYLGKLLSLAQHVPPVVETLSKIKDLVQSVLGLP